MGAYFKIKVMVSFRSFPWKGREPVSISNFVRRGEKETYRCGLVLCLPHIPPPPSRATLLQSGDSCWPGKTLQSKSSCSKACACLCPPPNLEPRSSTKARGRKQRRVPKLGEGWYFRQVD